MSSFSYWCLWHIYVVRAWQVLSEDYIDVLLVHLFSVFLCLHVVSCPISFFLHAGFDSFSSSLHVGLNFLFILPNLIHISKKCVACLLPFLLVLMRNCFCYTDGYSFPSNLISILLITAPVADLLSLDFPTGGAYACSGNSASCGYSSSSSISSSCCDSSVSYSFYYLLVSSVS